MFFLNKHQLKTYRKFIRKSNKELLYDLYLLSIADSMGNKPIKRKDIAIMVNIFLKILNILNQPEEIKKESILNGNEILDILSGYNVNPGPIIG